MYIQPYYLGLFVGAFGTVATEIVIVLISNYRDKKRKQKMQGRIRRVRKEQPWSTRNQL